MKAETNETGEKKLRWSIKPKARFFERLIKTHKLSENMIKREHTQC